MPLFLRHKVNQGMRITEKTKKNGKVENIVVDVVVRGIISSDRRAVVRFEVIEEGGLSQVLDLSEKERFDVLPTCTLHLPEDPIKDRPLSYPDNVEVSYEKRVLVGYYAPRRVEFSERRMYD